MNHFQKLFLYQLLLTLFVFNVGSVVHAQDMSEEQSQDIPVFDETDEGMSGGEMAGLVAGSVAGLAVGAGAIAVGVKKYQDNKSSKQVSIDQAGLPPTLPDDDVDSSKALRQQEEIAKKNEDQKREKKIQDIDKEIKQLQKKKKALFDAGVNKPGSPKRERQMDALDQQMEVLRKRKLDYQPSEVGKEQKSMFQSVAKMQARSLIDEESQKKQESSRPLRTSSLSEEQQSVPRPLSLKQEVLPVRSSRIMPASSDEDSEKISSDSEKARKILDDAFGEEAQKKEQRDQENQRRLDEKQKVYDDAKSEWRKADKALQDVQKQLMIYKNAPDINPDAKPPVIEAAQKEIDRLYKVMVEKQKNLAAPEQELKVVKAEIKQGFQAEAKALDAMVEESVKRTSDYEARAAVVAEQQKADEQEAKNVQKDLEKKQQALQDAGMELHKASIAVADASDALRNVKNANRYIEYETDEVKKAEAEAKEKKAREKFEERKAGFGRAQVHADRLAGEVDALEQKVQEIKLRPQVQEAVRPVVDEPVVFEQKMRQVPLEENPMHPVLSKLQKPDAVKEAYAKRQLMQDDLAESKFKAQQDEEARLKKMAEDRRTNKQKKKQSMVIGKPIFVRVGDQAMTSDDKKNIDLMKSKHTEEAKLSQAELSKKKLAESVEEARVNRERAKAQKNKKSVTGKVARKIVGRYKNKKN